MKRRIIASGAVAAICVASVAMYFWLRSPAPLQRFEHPETVFNIAISPDNRWLAARMANGHVWIWDTHSGKSMQKVSDYVDSMTFSGNGRWFAAIIHHDLVLWEMASGQQTKLDSRSHDYLVAVPNSDFMVQAEWHNILFTDLSTGTAKYLLKNKYFQVGRNTKAAVSEDGRWVAAGDDGFAVRIWDLQNGKLMRELNGYHRRQPFYMAFSPDKTMLASVDHLQQEAYLWDTASGKLIRTVYAGDCQSMAAVAFSGDGQRLMTLDGDGRMRYWNPATGEMTRERLYANGNSNPFNTIYDAAFSYDRRFLAVAAEKTVSWYAVR